MERQKYYYYYKGKAAAHINQLHSQLLLRMSSIENIDKKKIEAFELWCYCSWTEKKTNEWILNKMDITKRLQTTINHRKMAFIGHILKGKDITSYLLLGKVYGMRRRRSPKVKYSGNIKDISSGRSMIQVYRIALDRRKWRAMAVYLNLLLDDDD